MTFSADLGDVVMDVLSKKGDPRQSMDRAGTFVAICILVQAEGNVAISICGEKSVCICERGW